MIVVCDGGCVLEGEMREFVGTVGEGGGVLECVFWGSLVDGLGFWRGERSGAGGGRRCALCWLSNGGVGVGW